MRPPELKLDSETGDDAAASGELDATPAELPVALEMATLGSSLTRPTQGWKLKRLWRNYAV